MIEGEIAGLLAALTWAATGLLVRAHGAGLHAIVINALRCSIAGVIFVIAWPFISNHQAVPAIAWLFLIASMLAGLGIGDGVLPAERRARWRWPRGRNYGDLAVIRRANLGAVSRRAGQLARRGRHRVRGYRRGSAGSSVISEIRRYVVGGGSAGF